MRHADNEENEQQLKVNTSSIEACDHHEPLAAVAQTTTQSSNDDHSPETEPTFCSSCFCCCCIMPASPLLAVSAAPSSEGWHPSSKSRVRFLVTALLL